MGLRLGHLTVLLWVLMSVSAQDCVYKECDCYDGKIDCDYNGFKQMPKTVNLVGAQQILVLNNNMITEIPANSLPYNLSEIDLLNNPTTIIADTAFDGSIYTLQTLSLSFAIFTRIPNAFGHLRALKYLTIQDVNVQDWNEDALRKSGQTLTSIILDNVTLRYWPNWMQNCTQLTELLITHCSVRSIPDGALDKVSTSLTSLNLANNNLTSIPKAISQLSALTYLNLEQNSIIDITWFPNSIHITSLFLSYNKISNSSLLNEVLRRMGSSINLIGINYNQLTTIPDFSAVAKIDNLDFSDNKISDPNSGSFLPTINSIDLSYNFLPAIPRGVSTLHQATSLHFTSNLITSFVGTDIPPSVTLLDLGYNLITELTDNCFPPNSQLGIMRLNNNPISKISDLAFTNLPQLTALDLQNTRITRLPLALRSLTSLVNLDMTDSDGLVCTCMETSLQSWVLNLISYEVGGMCGEMSIYDFFSKLSPDCPTQ